VKAEDLIEIEQIRQLKARYFRAMDQKNWDEWESVFTEDAVFDFSAEGSPLITGGIWSMEDMLWWPEDQGGAHLWGMGWYYEKYRKDSDGRWSIAELTLKRIKVEVDGVQTYPPL